MGGEIFQGKGQLGLAEIEEELSQVNKRYAILEGEISSLSADLFSFPCGAGLIGVSEEKLNNTILKVQETIRVKKQELAGLKERQETLEKLKVALGGNEKTGKKEPKRLLGGGSS